MTHILKKVFCFGVFDGIHAGHIHMLKEAKNYGDYLIVAVTQDHIVEQLKSRKTRNPLLKRIDQLRLTGLVDLVVTGDAEIMTWQTLQSHAPQVIALGYDQQKIKHVLDSAILQFSFPTEIVVLSALEPDKLHSSLLFGSST